MLNILKGVAAIFGLFIGASLISAASPKIGMIVALACLILPVVAMIRPIPRIGLGHRGFSLAVLLLIGLPATFATQEIISNQKEAELAELKTNDPAAYLSVLKESDTDRWLSELAIIAPEQHAVELVKIEKETRRVKKAARLQAEAEAVALRQAECGSKNATTAYVMSQAPVKKQLRAPSTVEFPWITDVSSKAVGNCRYQINAYLDSQNGYGAMVRSRYSATMLYHPEGGSWSALDVKISQ